ncbi:MAG TPA: glycosyltransferase family 39 protein [Candidatus Andersenbacteria bacterium]|nr:glycosyltransferase family 39 protein [Candidatus Andersenbacteria bacterium]
MRKNVIIAYCLLLTTCLAVALFIKVSEVGESISTTTGNSGEITASNLVGQTFTASQNNLQSIGVLIATYSGRDNTHPVFFELKESAGAPSALRSVSVNPEDFGDNQFYDFSFDPISDSARKPFFFSLTSPDSVHGNAIAVNTNTKDPYPGGVAHIRGSGRQNIDLGFRASYNVPLGIHAVRTAKEAVRTFITTWHDSRHVYALWLGAFIPIFVFILFSWYVFATKRTINTRYTLFALALVAFCMRLLYATSLPYTVDEGNYLYDAWALLQGKFAGGDGYVKAPLVIVWIAVWEAILGHTALAGRVASSVAGAALVFPIFIVTQTLWNKRAGFLSSGIWAVCGSAVVATMYAHTQPVAIFFGVSGIALLAYALKEKNGAFKWLLSAGIFIGLAVASRKSMLGLGLTVVLLLLTLSPTIKTKMRNTLIVGLGFFAVLSLFFTFAYSVYGTMGIVEAIGINSASDGISSIEESQIEQVRAYSLRGMTPFFRESLPLILLSLLGVGFSLRIPRQSLGIIEKTLWLIPFAIFYWAFSFFFEYEGEAFMQYGIRQLWWLFAGLLLTAATLRPSPPPSPNVGRGELAPGLLAIVWVGSLAFFYMNWIKFHANYISEFIPPLVIMAGVSIEYFIQSARNINIRWLKRLLIASFIIVAGWSAVVSNFITYLFEHTGQFSQSAANEAAQWAKENIQKNEYIFTGASLIAYMADRHVSLDIAHPRWYAYEFTRTNPKRLETFLPSAKDMVQAFRDANWLLMDSQTGFSFLMEYSEIEKGIESDWESVKGIENGSNTLTFYKRVKNH